MRQQLCNELLLNPFKDQIVDLSSSLNRVFPSLLFGVTLKVQRNANEAWSLTTLLELTMRLCVPHTTEITWQSPNYKKSFEKDARNIVKIKNSLHA